MTVNKKLFSFIFVGTILLMTFFMAGVKGFIYFLGYLIVVGLILKLVKNKKVQLVLLLVTIFILILGRYLIPMI